MKTIKNVEIARVGRFRLTTGWHEFTREQLRSAIVNAAGRSAARLGIGHSDPRWKAASGDGEPALGKVENLRLGDDGDSLFGDFTDVPEWFAEAMPSAYPGRSIEASVKDDDMRITGVRLLGTTMPGIDSLEDLRSFVTGEGPVLVAAGADNEGHQITVLLNASEPTGEPAETIPTPGVTDQEARMDPKEIRKALGLPEDATDEQVRAKFAEQFKDAEPTGVIEPTAEAEPEIEPTGDPEPEVAVEKPAGVGDTVLVAAAVFNEQRAEIDALKQEAAERKAEEDKGRRDIKASAAVQAGKIAPAEKDGIRTWLDDNEDAATKHLDSLAAGRIPVDGARGHGNIEASTQSAEDKIYEAAMAMMPGTNGKGE